MHCKFPIYKNIPLEKILQLPTIYTIFLTGEQFKYIEAFCPDKIDTNVYPAMYELGEDWVIEITYFIGRRMLTQIGWLFADKLCTKHMSVDTFTQKSGNRGYVNEEIFNITAFSREFGLVHKQEYYQAQVEDIFNPIIDFSLDSMPLKLNYVKKGRWVYRE